MSLYPIESTPEAVAPTGHPPRAAHAAQGFSLRDALAANDKPLSDKERAVIDLLLVDPGNSAFMSARELAEKAQVHESTVVRLAQKLGFPRYANLRSALRSDSGDLGIPNDREGDRQARDFELAGLVRDEIWALQMSTQHVPQHVIDAAAADALLARNIFICGNSHTAPAAHLLHIRLGRLGLTAINVPSEAKLIVEQLAKCTGDDMVVIFAMRTAPPWLGVVLEHLDELGATTLLITDMLGTPFSPEPTHVFAAPRGSDPNFRTLVVPIVLCYAFQLAIYHQNPVRGGNALASIESLREELRKNNVR